MEVITENGTFQSTEELLRNSTNPEQDMMALIINNTLEKQSEMAGKLRVTAAHARGVGTRIDTTA